MATHRFWAVAAAVLLHAMMWRPAVLAAGGYPSNTTTSTFTSTVSNSRATVSLSRATFTGTVSTTLSLAPTPTATFSATFTASVTASVSGSLSSSGSVGTVSATATRSIGTASASTTRTVSIGTPSGSKTASPSVSTSQSQTASISPSGSRSLSPTVSVSLSASLSTSFTRTTSLSASKSASTSQSTSESVSDTFTESETVSWQLRSEFEKRHNFMYSRYFLDSGYAARRLQRRRSLPVGAPYHASWRVKYRADTQLALYRTMANDAASRRPAMDIGGQRCDDFTPFGHPGDPNKTALPHPTCSEPRMCHLGERVPVREQHIMALGADIQYSAQGMCDAPNALAAIVAIKGVFGTGATYFIAGFGSSNSSSAGFNQTAAATSSFPSTASRVLYHVDTALVDPLARTAPRGLSLYSAGGHVAVDVRLARWRKDSDLDSQVEQPVHLAPAASSTATLTTGAAGGPVAPSANVTTTAASAVVCELHDVASYAIHAGFGVGATTPCTIAIDGGGSRTCASVYDYQFACDQLLTCTGFSTALIRASGESFSEVPTALHIETHGFTPEERVSLASFGLTGITGVLHYSKSGWTARRCNFPLAEAASVSLFLQQNYFASGFAQVFIRPTASDTRRVLVKQCGGTFGFDATSRSGGSNTASFLGEDDGCDQYALCYETPTLPRGTIVEVEVPSTMQQQECATSLSVIAEAKRAPQTSAGMNRTVAGLFGDASYTPVVKSTMVGRELRVASTSRPTVTLNIYAYRAVSTALAVTQTAFQCEGGRVCDKPAIELRTASLAGTVAGVLGRCGGQLPFASGWGLSGQCELPYDCLAGRSTFAGGTFTGLLQVVVDNAFINTNPTTFSLPSICSNFLADIYAVQAASSGLASNASSTNTTTVPLFPLVSARDAAVSPPLLAITELAATLHGGAGAAAESLLLGRGLLAAIGSSSSASASSNASAIVDRAVARDATLLFSVGDLASQRGAYYVNWDALSGNATRNLEHTMAPNITFACVVDTITANAHTCTVPLPSTSNYLQIAIAQSDLASNAVTIDYLDADARVIPALRSRCGAQFGFLGFAGRAQECDLYLRCVDSFLAEEYSSPATRPRFLRITAPNTLTSTSCNFALTSTIQISQRPFGSAANCTGYFCQSNRQCIPATDVCDGLRGDCSDLSDERLCQNFMLVENNATIDADPIATVNVTSLNDCRRQTVISGGQAMTLAVPNGYVPPALVNNTAARAAALNMSLVCTVWSTAVVTRLMPAPSRMLVTPPESSGRTPQLYIRFADGDSSAYGRCSAVLHCSGHGTLRNARFLSDGDSCVCDCAADFTGSRCNTLKSMGRAVSYVAVTARSEVPFVVAAYEDALAAGNKAITVSVGQFLPFNATHRALPFTFTSFDSATLATFAQQLFQASTLASVNARLDQLAQPHVAVIFGMDGLNSFFPVAACTVVASDNRFVCSASNAVPVGSVRINGFGITAFDVVATLWDASSNATTAAPSSRRQAVAGTNSTGANTTRGTCQGANVAATRTNLRASCYATTCMLDVTDDVTALNLESTNVTANGTNTTTATNLTECGLAATASVEATTKLTLLDIQAAADPVVDQLAEDGYMFGAIGGISAFVICSSVIVAAAYWFIRWLKDARREVGPPSLFQQLKSSGKWIAAVLQEEKLRSLHTFDVEGMIVSVSIAAVMLLGVMGLLWVLFATSQSKTSNFDIVVSFYESPVCAGGDSLKTLPYQLAAFSATGECAALQFVGESDGTLYARGVCERSSGAEAAPLLAMSGVSNGCESAPQSVAPLNACLPLNLFIPDREGYIVADCSDASLTAGYLTSLRALNPTIEQSVAVRSAPAPVNLRPREFTSAGKTVYAYPFTAQSAVLESTSHDWNTVASLFSGDYYTGQLSTKRPVMQLPGVFAAPGRANTTALDALELSLKSSQADINFDALPLRNYAPNIPDYPVGFVYNGFGTVNEVSGLNSAPGSHRYMHVAGTAFDIGKWFNDETTAPLDGFTVSLWARFSTESTGFVFAVTDFYEDRTTGASRVLEKLRTLVIDGPATTKRWFDRSFNVYLALYVDGATQSLSLAMTTPYEDGLGDTKSVTIAQWRMSDFATSFVFNDQWHHLSFHFGSDNSRPFVIIGVDGATEQFNQQYRKCLTRAPRPVKPELGTAYITGNAIDAAVLDGGVMYVGYFNGGVQGLTFTPSNLAIENSVRQGTREIRIDQAKRVNTYEMIAYALIICAFFALGAIIVALRNLKRATKREETEAFKAIERSYNKNIALLFGNKAPIAFPDAFVLANVNQSSFGMMLDEILAGPLDHPADPNSNKLPRALYLLDRPESEITDQEGKPLPSNQLIDMNPSAEQWLDFLKRENVTPLTADEVADLSLVAEAEEDQKNGEEVLAGGQRGGKGGGKAKAKGKPAQAKSGGGGKSGGSSGGKSSGGGAAGAAGANAVILTVLGTIQAASIYTSTWTLPDVYLGNIVPVLEVGSLDFFDGIFDNTLAAPIAQLVIGLIIVAGVTFVFVKDDNQFYSNALRYQQRRDRAEKVTGALQEGALNYLLKKVDPTFVLEKLFPRIHKVQLVEPEQRAEIALFEDDGDVDELMLRSSDCGLLVSKHSEDPKLRCALGSSSPVVAAPPPAAQCGDANDAPIVSFDAVAPTATKSNTLSPGDNADPLSGSQRRRRTSVMAAPVAQPTASQSNFGSATAVARRLRADPCPIESVPARCVEHEDCTLQIVLQSEVFPYRNRRTCCAIENGQRCGAFNGIMYACTHKTDEGNELLSIIEGEEDCAYAICEKHMKLKPAQQIKLSLKAALQKFFGKGAAWLFFYVVITVALAVYTPVMRTCLMILACHPTFQCEFPTCWTAPVEQRFATAAYLAGLMVLLLGIGFPIGFYQILADRRAVLVEIFTAPSYGGKFMEPIDRRDIERASNPRIVTSVGALFYTLLSTLIFAPLAAIGGNARRIVADWRAARKAADDHLAAIDAGAQEVSAEELLERREAAKEASAERERQRQQQDQEGDGNPLLGPSGAADGSNELESIDGDAEEAHSPANGDDTNAAELSRPQTGPRNPDGLEVESVPSESPPTAHAAEGAPPRRAESSVHFADANDDDDANAPGGLDISDDALSRSTQPLANAAGNVAQLASTTVSLAEWQRFLMTDPSAMTPLYEQLKFESMHFVPVLNCAKFLLLIPPLLLEPNSIPQIGLIATGEVTYALVLALMAPYVTVWMTLITLVGNIHQFLLVALQAYFTSQANDRDLSEDVGYAMLVVTVSYLVLVVFLVGAMLLSPIISQVLAARRVTKLFKRLGMSRPLTAPLYISPFEGAIVIEENEAAKQEALEQSRMRKEEDMLLKSGRRDGGADGGDESMLEASKRLKEKEEQDRREAAKVEAELAKWAATKAKKDKQGRAAQKAADKAAAEQGRQGARDVKAAGVKAPGVKAVGTAAVAARKAASKVPSYARSTRSSHRRGSVGDAEAAGEKDKPLSRRASVAKK